MDFVARRIFFPFESARSFSMFRSKALRSTTAAGREIPLRSLGGIIAFAGILERADVLDFHPMDRFMEFVFRIARERLAEREKNLLEDFFSLRRAEIGIQFFCRRLERLEFA